MDERLLTYHELADALGRSHEAVRALCIRKRWRRTIGNDGKARIHVPVEVLDAPRTPDGPRVHAPADPERSPSAPPDDPEEPRVDARALIALLEARVTELSGEVQETRATIARLNSELMARTARADVLEALLAVEKQHGEELRADRDRWHAAATATPLGLLERIRRAFASD